MNNEPEKQPATMTEAAKRAKAEYMRAWRKKNPDRVKAYRAKFWNRKGEEMEAAKHGET